jgi:CubicO group peptidase (beta-lactamase class C family)
MRKSSRSTISDLKSAWAEVELGAKTGAFPGAVGLVSKNGKILFHEVCGFTSIYPRKTQMSKNSIFDLASVTKAVATTTASMKLFEQGAFSLDDEIGRYLPEFRKDEAGWKNSITIKHLLNHISGLPAWSDLYRRHRTRDSILNEVLTGIEPIAKPGTSFVYSDLGFILLGQLIETISGKRLDIFARDEIFRPLGMKDTGYNPKSQPARFASTEYSNWRGEFVRGKVHDENAYAMDGISGHAGLFSTALDLCLFFRGLPRLLSAETMKLMTMDHTSRLRGYVGLGWWIKNKATPNIGSLPPKSFGHNGYTGTSVWVDPESGAAMILLTNRIHPVREGDPSTDKSVGIMMSRKTSWAKVNRNFQDKVIETLI